MIFRFKATITGNKIFMREYEVRGSSSLYAFHLYLQNDLGFAPDQMVLFRALDQGGKVKREYGLFDVGDGAMDTVTIEGIYNAGLPSLEYVYDMFKERFLVLEFVSKEEGLARRSYPRLVAERGKNPDQFSDNYDDFEHMLEPGDHDLNPVEPETENEE